MLRRTHEILRKPSLFVCQCYLRAFFFGCSNFGRGLLKGIDFSTSNHPKCASPAPFTGFCAGVRFVPIAICAIERCCLFPGFRAAPSSRGMGSWAGWYPDGLTEAGVAATVAAVCLSSPVSCVYDPLAGLRGHGVQLYICHVSGGVGIILWVGHKAGWHFPEGSRRNGSAVAGSPRSSRDTSRTATASSTARTPATTSTEYAYPRIPGACIGNSRAVAFERDALCRVRSAIP